MRHCSGLLSEGGNRDLKRLTTMHLQKTKYSTVRRLLLLTHPLTTRPAAHPLVFCMFTRVKSSAGALKINLANYIPTMLLRAATRRSRRSIAVACDGGEDAEAHGPGWWLSGRYGRLHQRQTVVTGVRIRPICHQLG